jgi:hypothetical protein
MGFLKWAGMMGCVIRLRLSALGSVRLWSGKSANLVNLSRRATVDDVTERCVYAERK